MELGNVRKATTFKSFLITLVKKTFKSSCFSNIYKFHDSLFEIHQRFKGQFLKELRVSFNVVGTIALSSIKSCLSFWKF